MKAAIISVVDGESLELYLSIFDNSPSKRAFVTEEFVVQASKGGYLVGKASSVFDVDDNADALILVIKIVKVALHSVGGTYGRTALGVAVCPLPGITVKESEQVLHVVPSSKDEVFASLHEDVISGKKTPSLQNRLVH